MIEKIEGISFSEDSNNDLTVSLTRSSLEVSEIEDTVKHCNFN